MIGPALAGAAFAGAGTTLVLGGRRWGSQLHAEAIRRVGASEAMRADLAAISTDAGTWVRATAGSMAGAGLAGIFAAVLAWGTVGPLAAGLVPLGGTTGFLLRRRALTSAAARARAGLRLAALELAELTSLALGAGLGVAAALERAAGGLSGPTGLRLGAVARSGAQPWSGIEALGADAAVHELEDLGRTLSVGVERQARTREVLLGWAGALRAAQLEEAEAAAGAATEAMTGPLALVAFGFLLAVGVPSVLQLLSGVNGVHL